MSSKNREQILYSKQYPEVARWLNQCVICGSVGYKPEMPTKIFPGFLAENIRKLFKPLIVNEINLCNDCAKHWIKSMEQDNSEKI